MANGINDLLALINKNGMGGAQQKRTAYINNLQSALNSEGLSPSTIVLEQTNPKTGSHDKIVINTTVRCSCGRLHQQGKESKIIRVCDCAHTTCTDCEKDFDFLPGKCSRCGVANCGRCLFLHTSSERPELRGLLLCKPCSDALAKKRWWE